ncbi:Sh3 Domain-Containing Protein 21 [Manis pentadactyla]|nr:Sh3 Domain-Containing Protein 21 [Manis pentadactyla]
MCLISRLRELRAPSGALISRRSRRLFSELGRRRDRAVRAAEITEDMGWWEGESQGRRGVFPDNFVLLPPPIKKCTDPQGKWDLRNQEKEQRSLAKIPPATKTLTLDKTPSPEKPLSPDKVPSPEKTLSSDKAPTPEGTLSADKVPTPEETLEFKAPAPETSLTLDMHLSVGEAPGPEVPPEGEGPGPKLAPPVDKSPPLEKILTPKQVFSEEAFTIDSTQFHHFYLEETLLTVLSRVASEAQSQEEQHPFEQEEVPKGEVTPKEVAPAQKNPHVIKPMREPQETTILQSLVPQNPTESKSGRDDIYLQRETGRHLGGAEKGEGEAPAAGGLQDAEDPGGLGRGSVHAQTQTP